MNNLKDRIKKGRSRSADSDYSILKVVRNDSLNIINEFDKFSSKKREKFRIDGDFINDMIEKSTQYEHLNVQETAENIIKRVKTLAKEGILHLAEYYAVPLSSPDGFIVHKICETKAEQYINALSEYVPRGNLVYHDQIIYFHTRVDLQVLKEEETSLLTSFDIINLLFQSRNEIYTRLNETSKQFVHELTETIKQWSMCGGLHIIKEIHLEMDFPYINTPSILEILKENMGKFLPVNQLKLEINKENKIDIIYTIRMDA